MEPVAGQSLKRMYFLDNLRAFIVLLVIVFHVGIGYMSPPVQWWYVNDTKTSPLFNLFVMDTDVFIMPIMFMLAGYFALPVLKRKGVSAFLKGKVTRIAIPWLAGVLFFAPPITYMIWFSRGPNPPEYMTFWKSMFFTPDIFNHAHYWFLGELTWFFLILTALYQMKPAIAKQCEKAAAPSLLFFLGFGLLTSISFFVPNLFVHPDLWYSKLYVISMQPTRFFIYVFYFALGVYAWRNLWFTEKGYMPGLGRWTMAMLAMLIIFMAYRISFIAPQTEMLKAGHGLVHAFFCLAMSFFLISLFHKFLNSDAYLWRKLSANSYTIYYIHQFIVLPIAYMVQQVDAPVAVKYVSVAAASVILNYLAAEYIVGGIKGLFQSASSKTNQAKV